jgi:hypothetical protein
MANRARGNRHFIENENFRGQAGGQHPLHWSYGLGVADDAEHRVMVSRQLAIKASSAEAAVIGYAIDDRVRVNPGTPE